MVCSELDGSEVRLPRDASFFFAIPVTSATFFSDRQYGCIVGRPHRRCRLRDCRGIDRLPSAPGLNMEQLPTFRAYEEKNPSAETDFDMLQ